MFASAALVRRAVLVLGLAGLIGLQGPHARADDPAAAPVSVSELMAKGELPDIVQGSASAPVTVIEYASMTCTHCAAFHKETYPTLKAQYIDTGKVRFILREFPLDALAAAGFMVARCGGDDNRRIALVDLMFDHQDAWAFVDKPAEALFALVKQAGFTEASFDKCLQDEDLFKKVQSVRTTAAEKFHVSATPTFFLNGKRVAGEMTVEELKKQLDLLLKE